MRLQFVCRVLPVLLAAGLWTCAAVRPVAAQELTITKAEVDAERCRVYVGDKAAGAAPELLQSLLGLVPPLPQHRWVGGDSGYGADKKRFGYLIAFRKPVAAGSLFVRGTPGKVFYLKSGAGVPKDPLTSKDWVAVATPPSQSGALLAPLPAKFTTQALWVVDDHEGGESVLEAVRLFKDRWQNVVPAARAYASHEYYRPPADFVSPFLYAASLVSSGTGTWYNVGKGKDGRVSSPPLSDLQSEWFMLSWDEPHTIRSLWLHSNIRDWSLEQFVGPDSVNPRVGTSSEWRKVRNPTEQYGGGRWIHFEKPLTTRGLRLTITKVDGPPQIAFIDGFHALEDLGQEPVRELAVKGPTGAKPPFGIDVDLKKAGNLTLVVNDAQGRRVRNVMARIGAEAGKQQVAWDLKNEQGIYVPPGEYHFSAVAMPTLQPRYEFTVYPNVNEVAPENPAWFTGAAGSGGWLADHCNNSAVCTVGERVFLASYMAESGVALIECTLEGHKRWGHQGFAAWTGVGMLATDGKTLFNQATVDGINDCVWGVDVESKQVRQILSLFPSGQRKRGPKGFAATDGKLMLSVGAPQNWLADAAAADDVDLKACYPLYPPQRPGKIANQVTVNQPRDFVRLFRLADTPPGTSAPGSLISLQSMRDAAPRQHIVLSFRRPVPIGSLVLPRPTAKDVKVRVSMLKPDAMFPPRANQDRDWVEFPVQQTASWDVIAAPAGAETRALRLSFTRGEVSQEDQLLSASSGSGPVAADDSFELGKSGKPAAALNDLGGSGDRWQAQLDGVKILRRRFKNLSPTATVQVDSGRVAEDGTWDADRKTALTASDPAIYVQEWAAPQKIRGLAIKEIEAKLTKIDVYTGPDSGPIDIAGTEDWQNVAEYLQSRRMHYEPHTLRNHDGRYLDGYVDFGREFSTRAVRLRVVEQWADKGNLSLEGLRLDRLDNELDPRRCRIYGVAAMGYLGGELPVDSKITERIEVYDAASGKLQNEVAIEAPGRLATNRKGDLFAVSGSSIVKVDRASGKHQVVLSELDAPGDFAFDEAGNVYVSEHGSYGYRIRKFDPQGQPVHTYGHRGPRQAGPWDPEVFGRIVDVDIDQEGKLWVVEDEYWPKRVLVFNAAGKYEKELLGNTPYGGGGVLDPFDKSRLMIGPLEFALDWKTGHSYLKNLTWTGSTLPGEMPVHIDGRIYVTTWKAGISQDTGIVYRYEKDHLVLAAAMGRALGFEALKTPEMIGKLGAPQLDKMKFLWSDTNGNGEVDAEEVKLSPQPAHFHGLTRFNRDLGAQCGRIRYSVKEFLPSGVPVYEETLGPEAFDSFGMERMSDGNYYRMGGDGRPEAGFSPKGETIWTYPNEGAGGHALFSAKPWFAAQVVSQLGIIGHEAPGGELGEFLVFHTNAGGWNVMTSDGLLVGSVFRDMRDPMAKPWSMNEHDREMELTDVSLAQEHFQGYFCQSQTDGKFYAVAGHNHASVVEIEGFDQAKRYSGKFSVSGDDIERSLKWDEQQEKASVYQRSPVVDCYRLEKPPRLDGNIDDWGPPSATNGENLSFYIGYDDANLYLAYATKGVGPFKNSGEQWDRLFKTGACLDIELGVDPEAPAERTAPVDGDLRVLFANPAGKPTAVLYRPVIADKSQGTPWRLVSPVNEVNFDDVRLLPEVRVAHAATGDGYVVEAAVPLAAIGLKPADGQRLKLDWGVLRTGPGGHEVLQRLYWANQATSITADAPSEARLSPELWGFVLMHDGKKPSTEDRFEADTVTGKPAKDKAIKSDVDDILETLK